jgi:Uma2 family endonuclease
MSGRDDMIHTHSGVKLTYDDYVLFPDDGQKHELIDGVHYVTPAPVWKHHTIVGNLFGLIWTYLQQHPTGVAFGSSMDVIFSHFDVVQPDVLYISHERLAQLEPSDWIKGAPNLVVEVGSPSTRKRDETIKHRLYERFGVDEYWIIDPSNATIAVFRRETARYARVLDLSLERAEILTTPLLPGLQLPLATIFED